jgi:malate dehydrogenase (oxaloacetate-decarboxylating)(NADP+)
MGKPVHIFQLGASVEEMVMAAIAVIDAQEKGKKSKFNLVLNVVN